MRNLHKNILQCLEETQKQNPDKIAFGEKDKEITYTEFVGQAKAVGTAIINKLNVRNRPIVILMDKTIECLVAMMGVVYSGNFYTIIDTNSPEDRIQKIVETLKPIAVITNTKQKEKAKKMVVDKQFLIEEMQEEIIQEELLQVIRRRAIDTDPMYVLFTSGSTGVPKGTVVCHRSVISYATWVKETFNIDETTIFGSQTPFYFSMSILDIFTTILTGATFYIIPKMCFSFPVKLIEFLQQKKINTIYWVPSALCIVANLKALEGVELPQLKTILFAGEVMPVKQLNIWRKHVPHALYANLYGPTEITDICTYYVVDREFKEEETLPIGKPCDNCDVLIIKEDGTQAKLGETGELCVRGSFLALGYYANPEKTDAVFTQNPVNTVYPEKVYRTGDIVKENDNGEILYLSRKDYQIKHMGYRIELGEIETAINSMDNMILCCCVYQEETAEIVLFYQAPKIEKEGVIQFAKEKLLPYMRPNKIVKLETMPYNANGKIDRVVLKQKTQEGE